MRLPNTVPNNLPFPQTSFIGREQECADVRRLLSGARQLTLIGSDGIGKTRLALEVATNLLNSDYEGIYWIEFPILPDPVLVIEALTSVLNVHTEPGATLLQSLTSVLQSQRLLLVLDNCDTAPSACARLAYELIRHCPYLTLLACSREGLGITGETVFCLPSLAWTPPEAPHDSSLQREEAARLFRECALQVAPKFTLTKANTLPLIKLCRQLDGLPLAIQLVAARLHDLSFKGIVTDLDSRFDPLYANRHTPVTRAQILHTVLDWTWSRLGNRERMLLQQLAVFVGGWTLETAETVVLERHDTTGEIRKLLDSLRAKMLIFREERDGIERYRMLESVRKYCLERLRQNENEETMRRRFCDYFMLLAEATSARLSGPEQDVWLARLAREQENFRAALSWYRTDLGGAEDALRLVTALKSLWKLLGRDREWQTLSKEAFAWVQMEERSEAGAQALKNAGDRDYRQGDYAEAKQRYLRARAYCHELGDRKNEAYNLNGLAHVAQAQGDYQEARHWYEQALQIFQEMNDPEGEAQNLHNLGGLARRRGELATARQRYEQALACNRERGCRREEAYNLNGLAHVAQAQGDYAEARRRYEQALQIFQEVGDPAWEAHNLAEIVKLRLLPDLFWIKREA